jgi:hypothetical protein
MPEDEIQQESFDKDSDWEYEYHESQTEVRRFTGLDIEQIKGVR